MGKKVICHDIDDIEIEVDSDELQFRPSVYGILIEDGKILLSKQWDGYDLPGGGVEINETLEEALLREFKEETGLRIKIIKPVYCGTAFYAPNLSNKGKYWNCQLIYFLVEKMSGEISVDGCDKDEKKYVDLPEWISFEKIKSLKFYNSINNEEIIKKAFEINNNQ